MTFLQPTTALALVAIASAIASSGCTNVYSYYRGSDGAVSEYIDPTQAFRMTASHDIPCDPDHVRVFQLLSWAHEAPGSVASIAPFASNGLEIADGCGQRVVYKEDCGSVSRILSPEMADDAARSRPAATGRWGRLACRHVMISRLAIPPEEPVARWVAPPPPATHSVAPVFEDRAP